MIIYTVEEHWDRDDCGIEQLTMESTRLAFFKLSDAEEYINKHSDEWYGTLVIVPVEVK